MKYTKEGVSETFRRTGWLPMEKIIRHPDLPSRHTILKLFSTKKMSDVWSELNIPNMMAPTKEEVSIMLKRTGWLSKDAINRRFNLYHDFPRVSVIVKVFNTTRINDVWQELGIPYLPQPKFTREEVEKVLRRTGWLTSDEISKHPDLPSSTTVVKLFKGRSTHDIWRAMNIPDPTIHTKESVSKVLRETGWITRQEISDHPDLPASTTVLKLFGTNSIYDVWDELKIDY